MKMSFDMTVDIKLHKETAEVLIVLNVQLFFTLVNEAKPEITIGVLIFVDERFFFKTHAIMLLYLQMTLFLSHSGNVRLGGHLYRLCIPFHHRIRHIKGNEIKISSISKEIDTKHEKLRK